MGNHISISRPKIHRLPRKTAVSRFRQTVTQGLNRFENSKVLLISGFMGFLVVSAVLVHVNKLWSGGSFIQEASAHSGPEGDKPVKSLIIKGKNGEIVGQVTHIPPQTQHLSDIKTMTEVDNKANRDLLSVVNKY